MRRLISCLALSWFFVVNLSSAAQVGRMPASVGNLVMAKRPGVHFRIKNQDVEAMHCGVIERVRKTRGEWLWLGRGWVWRRDVVPLAEAVSYFSGEIRRKPTPFAYVARAAAKGRQEGSTAETDGDLEQALKLDDEYAAAYFVRGVGLRERGELDAAAEAFTEALNHDRTIADAHDAWARVWFDKAKVAFGTQRMTNDVSERLLKHFNRAIQLSPRLAKAYRNRAAVYLAMEDYEHALSDVRESLQHDPDSSAAYRLIAECQALKGDAARALTAATQAVRLDPKCGKARLTLGEIYERQGRDEKALAELTLAVEYLPRNAKALKARARLYYRRGEIDKYKADRLSAARLAQKSAAATSDTKTCGESKSQLANDLLDGQWLKLPLAQVNQSESKAKSNEPAQTAPPVKETPYSRARTLDASARRCATSTDERYLNGERAVEAATQACELTEWKAANFVDTLAAAYAATGDFEAAVKWQTKAIELGNVQPPLKDDAAKRLDLYRAHKPCREDAPGRLAREPASLTTAR